MTTRITVAGAAPYDVIVGTGLLAELPRLLESAARVAILYPEVMRTGAESVSDATVQASTISTMSMTPARTSAAMPAVRAVEVVMPMTLEIGAAGHDPADRRPDGGLPGVPVTAGRPD